MTICHNLHILMTICHHVCMMMTLTIIRHSWGYVVCPCMLLSASRLDGSLDDRQLASYTRWGCWLSSICSPPLTTMAVCLNLHIVSQYHAHDVNMTHFRQNVQYDAKVYKNSITFCTPPESWHIVVKTGKNCQKLPNMLKTTQIPYFSINRVKYHENTSISWCLDTICICSSPWPRTQGLFLVKNALKSCQNAMI